MRSVRPAAPTPINTGPRSLDVTGSDIEIILHGLGSELEILNLFERRGVDVSAQRAIVSVLISKLKGPRT